MKVFISWSGDAERQFARFLHAWLPLVIQTAKPWMSEVDIARGSHAMRGLGDQLDQVAFGIVVLSAANQHSPWINFEAGAVSKSVTEASLVPLLLNLPKTDVVGPLAQFQAVDAASKAEVLQLVEAINARLPEPLSALAHFVDREWSAFEAAVRTFRDARPEAGQRRTDRELLDEVLLAVRELGRDGAPGRHTTNQVVNIESGPVHVHLRDPGTTEINFPQPEHGQE
ncbi:toll/interleukin-1 receptor domain-containing protein [Saccharothrix longispora]|uniref:TIR domain-containing protein n=1 Tax=Saccharothrix longispora TaxID=33920 RepID=A0ABU1PVE3_9PSEU|nr:toll/interleukin-1 receptor domain-containing protein [Saccharothrix longispora]MDR6593864.1 hypothetical protein [Saccharothrix longispora]